MSGVDLLLSAVQSGRGRHDGEEVVDDYAHAVQTAALALAAGAADDLVAAALLHDVGHAPALTAAAPRVPHERLAAELLAPLLGERAAFVVGRHVEAKRHLCAVDPAYLAGLSPASVESLDRQGGARVVPDLLEGWGPLALQLRRWDDAAKVVDAPEPEWDALVAVVRRAVAAVG